MATRHIQALEERSVSVEADGVELKGDLVIPERAAGVVLFSHGSGSGRKSPRNRFVAEELQRRGLATLLLDLLTAEEEEVDRQTGHLRFDIGLLARRLAGATDWLGEETATRRLPIGYFGASTGAAAALAAAAWRPRTVGAVVSRGGRPDLAGKLLERVEAPTLLIVGGNDFSVTGLNREAFGRLRCPKSFQVVSAATHLFEEAGALEAVARLAGDWFVRHLTPTTP